MIGVQWFSCGMAWLTWWFKLFGNCFAQNNQSLNHVAIPQGGHIDSRATMCWPIRPESRTSQNLRAWWWVNSIRISLPEKVCQAAETQDCDLGKQWPYVCQDPTKQLSASYRQPDPVCHKSWISSCWFNPQCISVWTSPEPFQMLHDLDASNRMHSYWCDYG